MWYNYEQLLILILGVTEKNSSQPPPILIIYLPN